MILPERRLLQKWHLPQDVSLNHGSHSQKPDGEHGQTTVYKEPLRLGCHFPAHACAESPFSPRRLQARTLGVRHLEGTHPAESRSLWNNAADMTLSDQVRGKRTLTRASDAVSFCIWRLPHMHSLFYSIMLETTR